MRLLCLFLVNFLLFVKQGDSFNPMNKPSLYQSSSSKTKFRDDSFLEKLEKDDIPDPSNILFFTSVSNSIPAFVYNDFLNSLSNKYHNNVLVPKEKDDLKKLPSDDRLTVISHASGAVEALKYANKIAADHVIILGTEEVQRGIYTIKNLSTGAQSKVKENSIIEFLNNDS